MYSYQNFRVFLLGLLLLLAYTQPLYAEGFPESLRVWAAGSTTANTPSAAQFALGANLDDEGDPSLKTVFETTQSVDVHAYIKPAASDVGKSGFSYVVIRSLPSNKWYLINAAGSWVTWTGTVAPLQSNLALTTYKPLLAVKALETLRPINNRTGKALNYEIFVGYKTDGDIHFNTQPLKLEILAPVAGTTKSLSVSTLPTLSAGAGKVTSAPAGINCGAVAGTPVCNAGFVNNAAVVLTATPDANSIFTGWTGACTGTINTCNVTMDAAKSVTAVFAAKPSIILPVNWLQHDFKLNNIGVGVESVNNVLLYSLGDGFDTPAAFDAKINYKLALDGYSLLIDGLPINDGDTFRFNDIQYGSSKKIERFRNGVLVDTYTLFFTNLPVIQLDAARIVDEPKLPGNFRLMTAKYQQDTGVLNMGIEFRGNTAQTYPKKPYSIEIGSATNWATETDIKLLDLRKDSDWILDAAYRDQLAVRNLVGHDLFRALRINAHFDAAGVGKGQASIRGRLTEVIQNGSYQGTYVLQEKPDRKLYDLKKIAVPVDANGVEQWQQVDFTNPDNGSVLYKARGGATAFFDMNTLTTNFEQEYPKPENVLRWEPLRELATFIATATDQDFIAGIGARIDIDSVVDWWLLVDASSGGDNIKKNFMLGRNASGKFFISTWDHDATFAMGWDGAFVSYSMSGSFNSSSYKQNNLIKRLRELPATGFNSKLKARWNALRATVFNQANIVARYESYALEFTKGGAKARNLVRWPGTGGSGANDLRLGTVSFINDTLTPKLLALDKAINALPVQ